MGTTGQPMSWKEYLERQKEEKDKPKEDVLIEEQETNNSTMKGE